MKIYSVFFIGTLLVLSSCRREYYAPYGHNVPLFRDKNEMRITTGITGSNYRYGYELQGAYSPARHLGIIAGYHDYLNLKISNNYARYMDIGAGYYIPFKYFVFELYTAYGNGYMINVDEMGTVANNYHKIFLQQNGGFTFKNFNVMYSLRAGEIRQYNIRSTLNSANSVLARELDKLNSNKNSYIVEPGFTIRFGSKHFKAQLQYSVMSFINNPGYPAKTSTFSVGGCYTINTQYIKEKWQAK